MLRKVGKQSQLDQSDHKRPIGFGFEKENQFAGARFEPSFGRALEQPSSEFKLSADTEFGADSALEKVLCRINN